MIRFRGGAVLSIEEDAHLIARAFDLVPADQRVGSADVAARIVCVCVAAVVGDLLKAVVSDDPRAIAVRVVRNFDN